MSFFEDIPAISDRLITLNEVGLGYLTIGQSATTHLAARHSASKFPPNYIVRIFKKLFICWTSRLSALHYEDVKKLIEILQRLVDKGKQSSLSSIILISSRMPTMSSTSAPKAASMAAKSLPGAPQKTSLK